MDKDRALEEMMGKLGKSVLITLWIVNLKCAKKSDRSTLPSFATVTSKTISRFDDRSDFYSPMVKSPGLVGCTYLLLWFCY